MYSCYSLKDLKVKLSDDFVECSTVTLTSDKYKSQKFANQLACMADYKVCSDACPT